MIRKTLLLILLVGCVHVASTKWVDHRKQIEEETRKVLVFTHDFEVTDKDYDQLVTCVVNKLIEIGDRNKCPYSPKKDLKSLAEICFKDDQVELSRHFNKCVQDVLFNSLLKM